MEPSPLSQHQFNIWYAFLYNICYRYLKNPDDASDIATETLVKWCGQEKNTILNDLGWLRTTAIRLCLNELRRRKKTLGLDKIGSSEPASDPFPAHEEQDIYQMRLTRLSPREKEAWEFYMEGFLNEEIASMMKISYNRVAELKSSARQKLKAP